MIQEALPLPQVTYKASTFNSAKECSERGPRSLSDIELVSLLFKMDLQTSAQWLEQMGSLSALVNSSDLAQSMVEFTSRYIKEDLKRGDALTDVHAVREYLVTRLRGYPYEVFSCLFLDNKHRVIEYEELFKGTIDSSAVHPREVVRKVIGHNAAAVIFAHNHPSGVAEPSQADHRITDKLKDALGLLDCRVLDHFIIGDEVVSFAERGYL
jgi:DNA repair protein RadC